MPDGLIELYDRHFESVYGHLCVELGDATAAEDAVVDVFVAAADDLARYAAASPWDVQEWLLTMAQDIVGASADRPGCARRQRSGHVSSTRPSEAPRRPAHPRAR